METSLKKKSGITLVALVITIIVLLILAGVVIKLAVAENGVILRAKDSANKYNQAQDYEIGIMDDVSKEYDSIIGGNWIGGDSENNIENSTGGNTGGNTDGDKDDNGTDNNNVGNVEVDGDTVKIGDVTYSKSDLIGKYVNYQPEGETYNETITIENTSETYTVEPESLLWRIWGFDSEKMYLISSAPTNAKLDLRGVWRIQCRCLCIRFYMFT